MSHGLGQSLGGIVMMVMSIWNVRCTVHKHKVGYV